VKAAWGHRGGGELGASPQGQRASSRGDLGGPGGRKNEPPPASEEQGSQNERWAERESNAGCRRERGFERFHEKDQREKFTPVGARATDPAHERSTVDKEAGS